MQKYDISGKLIDFDETKTYLDFFIDENQPQLVSIDFQRMLTALQSRQIIADDEFKDYMDYLKRWTTDAPRKRFYRKLRKDGVTTLSGEYFFDEDGGEQIIDNLENTGKFADYLCKQLCE